VGQLAGRTNSQEEQGEPSCFARIGEFIPKLEQKDEFVKVVRNEVLPILKKQQDLWRSCPCFRRPRPKR
jgi:hypothetical protein